jgi:FlaA1/EpsC-like NDP-sugar epimerase
MNEHGADFEAAAHATYSGKRVLITGAAGTIGRELTERLLLYAPSRVIALDKDENGLNELDQELRLRRTPIPVEPYVADIRDSCRLECICQSFAPQVIFHAAAYKHVHLMELHPCEAILCNVLGTKNVLDVVAGFGAERFVFVSTIEAENPVNILGATKRVGELLVQATAQSGRLLAASARLVNVLASRGSVIPVVQRQIAAGGPVTLTHPDAVRDFMSIRQAVELILAAGCQAESGEVFVSDQRRPRNIEELARELILMAGLEPTKDIEIQIVGLRAGESIGEPLRIRNDKTAKSRFRGISIIGTQQTDTRPATRNISNLIQAARSADSRGIYNTLERMGLGFKPIPQTPSAMFSPPPHATEIGEVSADPGNRDLPPLTKRASS